AGHCPPVGQPPSTASDRAPAARCLGWTHSRQWSITMAELILTEAEKAATTWLELDDATIGKLVKKQALAIMDKSVEMEQITSTSAVMLLCGFAADMNADKSEYDIGGF